MIDDRTENYDLPLPHRDNELGVDVERIRAALRGIDSLLDGGGSSTGEEVHVLSESQTVIDLVEIEAAAGCTLFVEGVRLNKTQWIADELVANRLVLGRSYPAGHVLTVVS